MRIPSIPASGVPAGSEELQSATPGGGEAIGEAEGACSGAGGDRESEKGLNVVNPILTRDLGGCGWE